VLVVSVTVDEAHLGSIAEVADQLRSHGMRVDQVLDLLGVITGEVEETRCRELAAVAGVTSVDPSQPVQLPPPDSPVQ
jgi:hypothetical protein